MRGVLACSAVLALLLAATAVRAQDAHGQGTSLDVPVAGEPGASSQPAEAPVQTLSFLQLLIKGGWFMVPIALLSLLGLAVIIERFLALRRRQIFPPGFMPELLSVFKQRSDAAAALRYCEEHPSPIARVMAQAIRKLPGGEEVMERAIEDAGAIEVSRLRKNLRTLHGISAVAPMLGLLGTVWGMIQAFQVTASRGMGRPELLATGIYEALITTLSGLTIAVAVSLFYYYFLGRIDDMVARMNDQSEKFVEHLLRPRPHSEAVTSPEESERIEAAAASI